MSNTETTNIQIAAQQIYNQMTASFDGASGNMWTFGNAFDTMADFLMLTNQQAGPFLDKVYESFELEGAWYDDFIWPAVASLKAYDDDYSNVFAGLSRKHTKSFVQLFQQYVLSNWNTVHNGNKSLQPPNVHDWGTQNVWASINHTTWGAFTPRFTGGSWQCDINDSNNPQFASLGPFQDSVMNGLLLVFSTRLGRLSTTKFPHLAPQITAAKQAQANEMDFLLNWYNNGSSSDHPDYDHVLLSFPTKTDYDNNNYSSGILVRERVGTYAKQGGVYPELHRYDKDRFWCGDQGLQLGGLVDQGSDLASDVAVGIIKGVQDRMSYTDLNGNPWIRSAYNWPTDGAMCPGCYSAGGGGIFMRNLLYAIRSEDQKVISYVKTREYSDYIVKLANTAIAGPVLSGDPNPMFVLLDRLAVLNVAMIFESVLDIDLSETATATS